MNNEIVLQQPDDQEFKGQASLIEKQAAEMAIKTSGDYELAGNFLLDVKGIGKKLLERFEDPCKKARAAWQAMTQMRDESLAPFQAAETLVKTKMAHYNAEVEEKRRKEAEKARLKAELEARAERDRQIAEAKKLKDKEAVEALKAAPLEVKAVAPRTPEAPKVGGVSFRKVWKVQSVDASKLPARYLMPDLKAIDATVRGLGAKHGIPGVVVVEETITSARAF